MARRVPRKKTHETEHNTPTGIVKVEVSDGPLTAEARLLFDKVVQEVLHNDRELFDKLSKHEQSMVLQWMVDALITGQSKNAFHDILWEMDFREKPVSIDEFIHNDDYMGRVGSGLHPLWKRDLNIVFGQNTKIIEWLLCLSGDTRIPLLDGSEHTLEELHTRWQKDSTPFYVYSISPEGEVVPGEVTKVTKFGKDQLYKVTLDDGTSVRANSDHEFVGRDGVKRKLCDLKVGDKLMPFTTKKKAMRGQKHSGYETVYLPGPQKYAFTHRCVGKAVAGGEMPVVWEGDRAVLHHIDMDCLNNDPSNLMWMGWTAHRKLHTVHKSPAALARLSIRQSIVARDPDSPLRKGHKKFMNTRKGHKLSRKNLKKGQDALTTEDYVSRGAKGSAIRWADPKQHTEASERCKLRSAGNTWGVLSAKTDVTVEDVFEIYEGSLSEMYATLEVSRNRVVRLLRDAGLTIADLKKQYQNHKIVSIELDTVEHVYCLTVPEWGNFAISTSDARTGIFSGNTGAIGVGKTTIAMIALAYCTYRLSCMYDPAAYYGLLPESMIAIGIFSVTKRTVADTGYSKLRGYFDSSPYFQNKFPRNMKIDSVIDFSKTTDISMKILAGCVVEGTPIDTPYGPVPIERLEAQSKILNTVTSDGRVVPSTYRGVIDSGKKPCVEVCTNNGDKLLCSETQKVLMEQANGKSTWVKAEELREGATVYAVRPSKEGDGVLSKGERQDSITVQGVPESEREQPLPQHKDLRGQRAASDRPTEAVQQVSETIGAGQIPNTAADYGGWDEETVFEFIMQAMRVSTYAELLQRQQRDCVGEAEKEAVFDGMEVEGSRALEALLRGEQRIHTGTYIVSRRPCKTECKTASMAQSESRQSTGESQPLAREVPRKGQSKSAEVSTDSTRESEPCECSRTSESQTENITGYIYGIGLPTDGGVLWVKVLLLWQTVDSEDFDIRPLDSSIEGCDRRYGSEQHCSMLRAVQFEQEQQALGGMGDEEISETQICDYQSDRRVYPVKVTSVKPIGVRQTYDVVEVPQTHAMIASRIVTKNSQELHAIGLDVFSYAMDEANFMRVKQDKESGVMAGQAYDIYNAVYSRVVSRFMRDGGVIPGLMLLMSSKKAQSSFLEEHMKKVLDAQVKGAETTYVSDYPIWAVKPEGRFGTKHFRVEVGDKLSQSRLLVDNDEIRKGAQVVEVPDGLRKPFVEDVDQALRDLAGIATFNVSPLIRDRQSVLDAVCNDIPRPFDASVIIAGTEDDDFIEDYIQLERICRIHNGKHQPRITPNAPRTIHLDLALRGDSAGFAMGHIGGLVKIEKRRADGILSQRTEPYIIIDQMFCIKPPLSGEIELAKIRAYISFLSKFYNIIRVTADGFQSADMIQILNKQHKSVARKKKKNPARNPRGAAQFASVLSVDRTEDAYLSLRAALFDRRLVYYDYATLTRELLDLQRDIITGKVDHPERASGGGKGSKDVADAVAGVVANLLKDDRAAVGAQWMQINTKGVQNVSTMKEAQVMVEANSRIIAGRNISWTDLENNLDDGQ